MRQERELARHLAVGSDGTEYEVIEIQEYDERRTINGEWIRIDGFRRPELDDESFVNRKDVPKRLRSSALARLLGRSANWTLVKCRPMDFFAQPAAAARSLCEGFDGSALRSLGGQLRKFEPHTGSVTETSSRLVRRP